MANEDMLGQWRLLLALTCLAAVRVPTAEAADQPAVRVGLASIAFSGHWPDAARSLISRQLREGLTAARLTVISAELERCDDAPCWQRVCAMADAQYAVVAAVTERAKNYQITLEIITASTGAIAGTSHQRCEICGLEDVGEKMALAASNIGERAQALRTAPVRLTVRASPTCEATLDGRILGKTPVEALVAPGAHVVELRSSGQVPLKRQVQLTEGVDQTLDLTLPDAPSHFPLRTIGWSALLLGVASIAVGAYIVSLHGRTVACTPAERDLEGHCPKVYSADVLGAPLVGVGTALATLGGVWLYLGRETTVSDVATVRIGFRRTF